MFSFRYRSIFKSNFISFDSKDLFQSAKICSKVLRCFWTNCSDFEQNVFASFWKFFFRYISLLYKAFFRIFCKVFSFRYRSFFLLFQVSLWNLNFSLFKSKVFFVQKLRFVKKCKDLFKNAEISFWTNLCVLTHCSGFLLLLKHFFYVQMSTLQVFFAYFVISYLFLKFDF